MSGIYGVVSKHDCAKDLFYGIDYHSHLGTEYAGMAVLGDTFVRQIHNISQSQFKSKFFDDSRRMHGNKGIGVISAMDEQPIYLNSKLGAFCIVTNGLIENAEELATELLKKGASFAEVCKGGVNPTELVAKLIVDKDSYVDGIESVFKKIKGSCSLLILNKDGLIAARDGSGYSALAVGRRASDDTWAVTSETSAFPNSDMDIVKYLQPGEIVKITEHGMASERPGHSSGQICTFLWIYTGFPASSYEGVNAEAVRERCGRFLAKRDRDIDADVIAGVPDSGVGHAIGYAIESGKPFRRPLVKYTPGYGRSYTPPSQSMRDLVAKMKLIPIKEIIEGNRIVICDDSIVRGTQLKNFTIKKLWKAGAAEVHARPACPPLMFPCIFNFSTRSIEELVARRAINTIEGRSVEDVSEYVDHRTDKYRRMIDWIARDLEVTTLRYQTVEDMVEAVGLPRERLCLYCWTGKCPKGASAACAGSRHEVASGKK